MRLPSLLLRLAGSCFVLLVPACGLTLDYDPPRDGGMDVPGADAALDAPPTACRTDLDCANGDACDGEERCVDRVCVLGSPIVCPDDEDVCDGISRCAPSTGLCVMSPGAACETDDDPCNGVERCDPVLGCIAGPLPDCDDGVDCTVDACVAGMGCEHVPMNDLCDVVPDGVCTPAGCRYPTCEAGVTCVSDDPCFTAHCDAGGCVLEPIECSEGQECCAGSCVALGCDDGNACTDDRCARRRGCESDPHIGSCSDGNRCTFNDVCVGNTCMPGPRRSCIGGTPGACIGGACDDATGECVTVPLSDVPCVDGDACTTGDVCREGVCTSGSTAAECDDEETCTADSCDTNSGCEHTPVRDGITCPGIVASICIGGRCFSNMGCNDGRTDCDDDGVCECESACVGRICPALVSDCLGVDRCAGGQVCCDLPSSPAYGTCVADSCLGCCM